MFYRRCSLFFLCVIAFAFPFEHKYDKLFRFFSLKLIPPGLDLPSFFDKKIYFYPSDLIALALGFLALFAFPLPLRDFFFRRGSVYLWIVFLFTFLSIILSPFANYPIPYVRLLQLATPFILFSTLANWSRSEERSKIANLLLGIMILAAICQSLLAIAQYTHQSPLGLRILSEPNEFALLPMPSGKRWIFDLYRIGEITSIIRPSGTMPHANVLGGFLCASIIASFSFFFLPRWRLLAALLLPLQFFAMSLTFSRSAFFALILATLTWFGIQFAKRGFRATLADLGVRTLAYSIAASIAIAGIILNEQIVRRGGIVNYNFVAQGSDNLRLYYQNIALEIIKDNPLHGTGFQQLSIRSLEYTKDPTHPPASGTHNIYLYLAAETGLLSLAAFLIFIAYMLVKALKASHTPLLASLTALFVAFLFIGCCDFYPLLFQQGKIMFFLAAGLLSAQIHRFDERVLEAAS